MDRTGYEGLRIIAGRISSDTIINVFCDDSLKYNPYKFKEPKRELKPFNTLTIRYTL